MEGIRSFFSFWRFWRSEEQAPFSEHDGCPTEAVAQALPEPSPQLSILSLVTVVCAVLITYSNLLYAKPSTYWSVKCITFHGTLTTFERSEFITLGYFQQFLLEVYDIMIYNI